MEKDRIRVKDKRVICVYVVCALLFASVASVLGVVCIETSGIPIGEVAGQWAWFAKAGLLFSGCVLLSLVLYPQSRNINRGFCDQVIWVLICLGGVEAIEGVRQLYGFTSSNHSLFALTGSFFNPGPYSGYLALIFPLCLNEWLKLKDKKEKSWMEVGGTYLSAGVMLLILCVLPSGMSRSAWLAAAVSGLWVVGSRKPGVCFQ